VISVDPTGEDGQEEDAEEDRRATSIAEDGEQTGVGNQNKVF